MSEQAQDLAPLGTPEGNAEFIARFARATILALMKPALKVSLVEQIQAGAKDQDQIVRRALEDAAEAVQPFESAFGSEAWQGLWSEMEKVFQEELPAVVNELYKLREEASSG